MALYDDKKKKPYEPGFLPGAKLIPGSTADTIANAVGGFKANYNAKLQTGEQSRLANNLNFVNPADPASMIARSSNRGLTVAQPTVAAPGASSTQTRAGAGGAPPPRTMAQLDQASQAEVNARTSTPSPASMPQGAGASTSAGAVAAPTRRATMRPDGVAVVKMADGTNAYGANGRSVTNAQGTMTSVNQQNFGTAAVPQAPGSIARPGVASTFGLGVNDPRLNDQIARPQTSLAANQTPGVAVRGPDAMAEQYASREDREARAKLLSDLDSQRFRLEMIAGNPGRRGRTALEGLADNAQQRAALVNEGAQLSAGAVQGRENRANQFGISELEQNAATQRQQMQGDVTREGNQLGFQSNMAQTAASMIARPTYRTDREGNLLSVAGTAATNVVDAQGNPVREAQAAVAPPRDYAREADDKLLADLLDTKRDINGTLAPNALRDAMAELQQVRGASSPVAGGGQIAVNPKTGEKVRLNAQTGKWEPFK